MNPRIIPWAITALLLTGCASEQPVRLSTADDPTSSIAPEVPLPPPSSTLASTSIDQTALPEPPTARMTEGMGDMKHDMPGMAGDSHAMPDMAHAGMAMGTSATQHADTMPAGTAANGERALYTCTMHPQVISTQPGNCPLCGMKLVKKTAPARRELSK